MRVLPRGLIPSRREIDRATCRPFLVRQPTGGAMHPRQFQPAAWHQRKPRRQFAGGLQRLFVQPHPQCLLDPRGPRLPQVGPLAAEIPQLIQKLDRLHRWPRQPLVIPHDRTVGNLALHLAPDEHQPLAQGCPAPFQLAKPRRGIRVIDVQPDRLAVTLRRITRARRALQQIAKHPMRFRCPRISGQRFAGIRFRLLRPPDGEPLIRPLPQRPCIRRGNLQQSVQRLKRAAFRAAQPLGLQRPQSRHLRKLRRPLVEPPQCLLLAGLLRDAPHQPPPRLDPPWMALDQRPPVPQRFCALPQKSRGARRRQQPALLAGDTPRPLDPLQPARPERLAPPRHHRTRIQQKPAIVRPRRRPSSAKARSSPLASST